VYSGETRELDKVDSPVRSQRGNESKVLFTSYLKSKVTFKSENIYWNNLVSWLRGYGTLKYGDAEEKFNFLEIQELRP